MYIELIFDNQAYLGKKKFVFESQTATNFDQMLAEIKETLENQYPHLKQVIENAIAEEIFQMPFYGQGICQHCGQMFCKQTAKDKYCSLECSKQKMKQKIKDRQAKYRITPENKRKQRFRKIARYAIKKGEITLEKCAKCGCTENLQAHHISYAEGFQKVVVGLCKRCHSRLHTKG